MRLIDADALLERVWSEKIQAQAHGMEFSTCFMSPGGTSSTEWWYVEDLIENAPTIEPEPKWIPVTERLPKDVEIGEEYPTVIFCTKDDVYVGFYEHYNDGNWWSYDGDYVIDDVLAWMPLPEPYKEES